VEPIGPVTLIVTALAAGSSTGAISALELDVKNVVKETYSRLRGLVKQRIASQPGAALVLAEYETDPENWAEPLAKELTAAGAADDVDLVAVATALMELVDGPGSLAGKYDVTIKDSTAVQVGDRNIQVNTFGS
jgi:hypothetical protein